jgi:hypothetical protein
MDPLTRRYLKMGRQRDTVTIASDIYDEVYSQIAETGNILMDLGLDFV